MKRLLIPVAKIYTTKQDEEAVASVVRSGWILQGPKVAEFERLIAGYVGVPYAVATSSATTAIQMGLMALGIGPGDEVIVPSLSFIASANCIVHAGATPVFVDIDPRTYNLNPVKIEPLITQKTKAIIAVHQIGLAADMPKIIKIAQKHNLRVIEDQACGLGAKISGRNAGTFGSFSALSFHPRKAITTAEGGMILTKNPKWAKYAQMMRAHGASESVSSRHLSTKVMHESYPVIGYNWRMSDIHAALGISQFHKLDVIMKRRQEIASRYNGAFRGNPRIVVPFVPRGFTHTYQSYQIRLPGLGRFRTKIMQKLLNRGIATREGVMASHLEKPYKKMYPRLHLPETEKAAKETLILPVYPDLSISNQEYVIETFIKILKII